MVLTPKVVRAFLVMYIVHKGQVDKGGKPYFLHPLTVAGKMDDEDSTVVALLHDVIEDSQLPIKKLKRLLEFVSLTSEQQLALFLLTHDENDSYYEYIQNVSTNSLATKVKLEDLYHNSDLSRISKPTESDIKRMNVYQNSIHYLEAFLPHEKEKTLVY